MNGLDSIRAVSLGLFSDPAAWTERSTKEVHGLAKAR